MKKFILIWAVLIQMPCYAVSDYMIRRYIRPQLSSIISDFYQILKLQDEFPQGVISTREHVRELMINVPTLHSSCSQESLVDCFEKRNQIIDLIDQTTKLYQKHFIKSPIINLTSNHKWFKLNQELLHLRESIYFFVLSDSQDSQEKENIIVAQKENLNSINSLSNILMTEFLDPMYKEDFAVAYLNFFRMLQEECLDKQRYEILVREQSELNFYWHLLNVKLTKKLRIDLGDRKKFLNAIQNRWNQVLKIIKRN